MSDTEVGSIGKGFKHHQEKHQLCFNQVLLHDHMNTDFFLLEIFLSLWFQAVAGRGFATVFLYLPSVIV